MDKSFNGLTIKPISRVIEETTRFVRDRRDGKERSLKVGSEKFNAAFMDGIDWNRIITIAGLSGSGKSTLLRQWIREVVELNKDQQFDVLSFQFEMLGIDELAKDVSAKTNLSIKQIYSAMGKLSDDGLAVIEDQLNSMKDFPLYIVDNIGTVSNIKDTILYYCSENKLAERQRSLVVSIDHSLKFWGLQQ